MAKRKRSKTRKRTGRVKIKWWLVPPLLILLIVPGATAMGIVDHLANLDLYAPQLWTFAILIAGLFYGAASFAARSFVGGLGIYAGIGAAVLVILAVAVLGFRQAFPIELAARFFGVS